jgi:hypothetical protein
MDNQIKLWEVGCLLHLRIGMWSGRKMLTFDDMRTVGIDPSSIPEDIVNLGRKLLVPREEITAISKIESKARGYLTTYSMPFGMANAHFIPMKIMPNVDDVLVKLKKEFFELVDSFISRFEDMKNEIRKTHPEFWDKALRGCYPKSPELLRQKFNFNWHVFKISGIENLVEVGWEERQEARLKQEEMTKQIKSEVSDFVKEYVSTMRMETIKFCELMQARVSGKPMEGEEESKKLTGRSMAYFAKYVDKFGKMNIFGDNEIEGMLKEFRQTYLGAGAQIKDFENKSLQNSVVNALETIKQKAAFNNENGSKFIDSVRRRVII